MVYLKIYLLLMFIRGMLILLQYLGYIFIVEFVLVCYDYIGVRVGVNPIMD